MISRIARCEVLRSTHAASANAFSLIESSTSKLGFSKFSPSVASAVAMLAVFACFVPTGLQAAGATVLPENLGSGLKEIVAANEKGSRELQAYLDKAKNALLDRQGRVQVNIHLKNASALAALQGKVAAEGGAIVATNASYRSGVISAFIPVSLATRFAADSTVRSVVLVPAPRTWVGKTTAQSAYVHRTSQVNTPGVVTPGGLKGEGITVGVLSDSYDRAAGSNASDGVASGDLPGTQNSNNPQPVVVVEDGQDLGPLNRLVYTDEGRGMLEIIHDEAPGAKLAFASAFNGDVSFANNIRSLRTNGSALCDIIVDDVAYLNEPMFSDGIIAQAVDEVTTSTTLPGKPAAYFSSAGNNGTAGYSSPFRYVSVAAAKLLPKQNLKFGAVPKALYAGGFHDFDPGAGVDISQDVKSKGGTATLVFQWNDPFDSEGGLTTDYNLLVFTKSGDYVGSMSGVDNNFQTNQPLELPGTDLAADQTYQIVIARASGGSQVANLLRYVVFANGDFSGQYLNPNESTIYGHTAARSCNAVAAYVYDDDLKEAGLTPSLEEFSSGGPVTICFSPDGQRLDVPEVRQKPDMAGADGVNTTFFPPGDLASTDYDGDGFPNFFGTSAAAPSVAGVAALVLQAAGGPGAISPEALSTALKENAFDHDLDPRVCAAKVTSDANGISAEVSGNGVGADDANFFQVRFSAPSGVSLTGLRIYLGSAGLQFDTDPVTGFGPLLGTLTSGFSAAGSKVAFTNVLPSGKYQGVNGDIPAGNFNAGGVLAFGIDRDTVATGGGGNSADLLEHSTVVFRFSNGVRLNAEFLNEFGPGTTTGDGAGPVDALNATLQFSVR